MELGDYITSGSYGRLYRSKDHKYIVKIDKTMIEKDCRLDLCEFSYVGHEKEMLSLAQTHPNIVKMFDLYPSVGEENIAEDDLRRWWIIMEPAQGNIYNFPPIMLDNQNIIRQLFSGLAHIHSKRIIHGDLKHKNILVFEDGKRVAICDFGNAQSFDTPRKGSDKLTTLWFRAPESLAWRPDWDEKIDIWSMGVIYFFLLRRVVIYDGENESKCLEQISDIFGRLNFEIGEPNKEGSSKLLFFEKEDKILDACLVPLPRFRKSAQEIMELTGK